MHKSDLSRLLMIVLAATVMALAGCSGDDGAPGAPGAPGTSTGTITGTVTNGATNTAEAGVTVTATPGGSSTTTGADGTYTLADLPIGAYTLTFSKTGFADSTALVSVLAGVTATQDTTVNANDPNNPGVIAVTTPPVDDAGNPIAPGSSVTLTSTITPPAGSTVTGIQWTQSNSVDVEIQNATTNTPTVVLPNAAAYKDELIMVLSEPPIGEDQLPPNVPLPEGEFPGGLQDRFQVVGINPFALEETGLVTVRATVTTDTSDTFTQDVEIHAHVPWKVNSGLENQPLGIPVLLHGKDQASYDWVLTPPAGSSATLTDATTQNPYFTPDIAGAYTITVTDMTVAPAAQVTLDVNAGTWEGVITGQDADGRPLAANCTVCHNDVIAPDEFTPWAQSGHAEIFTNNLNTNSHYSTSCFICHTVGWDPDVSNGGIDDAPDYQAFLDAEPPLLANPNPNNWTTMLADYPSSAQLANIQCENCHGPQNGGAHIQAEDNPAIGNQRTNLSSDVCATCHGEPLRHARFQQWQLSRHANYELAIDEGESGNCSRCHTANGFLTWLPILLDDDPATDPTADIQVVWTTDETHPQTCATCHNPHNPGSTTGVGTDVTVRVFGDTPPLIAGFQMFGVGNGAICMTCHNSRRGLRNDATFNQTVADGDQTRAPHGSAQTDVLAGQNAYLVPVGIRGNHGFIEDTCVNCHMEQTPPPELLAYNLGGANHTFFARDDICSNCHGAAFNATGVQQPTQASLDELENLIDLALRQVFAAQTALGRSIDLGGQATITAANVGNIFNIDFAETHGRLAIDVTFTDGTETGLVGINAVDVLDGAGVVLGNLYAAGPVDANGNPTFTFIDLTAGDGTGAKLIKGGWNWNLIHNDGSGGIHNPSYTNNVLVASIAALKTYTGVQ